MPFSKILLLSGISVGVLCTQDIRSPKAAKYTLQHVNYYAEDFPPYTYSEDCAKRFMLVGSLATANNQGYCCEGITIKDKSDLKYHIYSAESYTISVDLLRNAGVGMKNIYIYQIFPEVIAAIETKRAECAILESTVYQWRVNHGVIDPDLLKLGYKISEGQYYGFH